MKFSSLDLPEQVAQGIEAVGFTECTPIQAKVLPISLAGKDVAGQAQTGTGKTAAFLITVFTRLLRSPTHAEERRGPRALVIAPTRELVVQILHDAQKLGALTDLSMQAVYGGVDYKKQRDLLSENPDLLVGTPGRLIDYFKQHVYTLKHVEILIVDEADRMFDMGFIADLRFMLRRLPPVTKRQSMLFSATLSHDVMELAYEHMNDAVKVEVNPEQVTAERVEHELYHVGLEEKLPLILGLLKKEGAERTLVFVNMKRDGEWLADRLAENGYEARAITGDVDQRIRLRLLNDFKSGKLPILVATDVASRGLHIEGVTHVINYDLPQDAEDYVHRVGRTARAGASGKAISLACEQYVFSLEAIEKYLGFKLPLIDADESMFVTPKPHHRKRRGHGRGGDKGRGGQPQQRGRSRGGNRRAGARS